MEIFPDVPLDEVYRRTAAHWSFDGPHPVPKGTWMCCPLCRSTDVQGRSWNYSQPRHAVTTPYRCDITFKCTQCAHLWSHGIVVTREYWEANVTSANRRVRWRNVLRDLEKSW